MQGLTPLDTAPQRVARNLLRQRYGDKAVALAEQSDKLTGVTYREFLRILCEAYKRGHKAGKGAERRKQKEKAFKLWHKQQKKEQRELTQAEEREREIEPVLASKRPPRKISAPRELAAPYGGKQYTGSLGKSFRLR